MLPHSQDSFVLFNNCNLRHVHIHYFVFKELACIIFVDFSAYKNKTPFWEVVGIEPLHILDKYYATELYPEPCVTILILESLEGT